MNKIYTLGLLFIAIVGFQGCGGGGGSSDTTTPDTSNIEITVQCTTIDPATPSLEDILTYQELLEGDIIIKDEEGSIVQIHTPLDQNSRVCIQSGTAHIQR